MKTWLELKNEIKKEHNIEGEDFVSEPELLTWANDAKDIAEKEIVSLYDRYLETEGFLTTVSGESDISLPADIYANKMTFLFFNDGSTRYEVLPVKKKEELLNISDSDEYRFTIVNSSASGIKLKLWPKARESSTTNLNIHYIRESKTITSDTDFMDIPIADGFIKQYIKDQVYFKEIGPMQMGQFSQATQNERKLMIEALNQMIPSDSADKLEPDLSFYEDFYMDMNYE